MIGSKEEIFSILREYNPWWGGTRIPDLPSWRRAAFTELESWLKSPPTHRAVLLSGARQVGKTTLVLQAIQSLLEDGTDSERILYATFDHPLLKLIGLEKTLEIWREVQPRGEGVEYLILDEIQYCQDWQTWLKHQVDFKKKRRIVVTGSAVPLGTDKVESGVGRWHTIKLATLSFFEYLQIKEIETPNLPDVSSLREVFSWNPNDLIRIGETAKALIPHFHEYLLRGGFPQSILVDSVTTAQKLMREDIVDKVLKRDMTALFGVRRVLELERTFLFLCLNDGGMLDIPGLCKNLGMKKPTVNKYIDLLEAAHLIYKLAPHGYGKEILRGKFKVFLADAAIPGSVLLKGRALLADTNRLGAAVEAAFFKHVFARYYQRSIGFSYWRGKKGAEVDIIAEVSGDLIPFEVKYQQSSVKVSELKGMQELCQERKIRRGYIITREFSDFGTMPITSEAEGLKIPAPLACYWLSRSEVT